MAKSGNKSHSIKRDPVLMKFIRQCMCEKYRMRGIHRGIGEYSEEDMKDLKKATPPQKTYGEESSYPLLKDALPGIKRRAIYNKQRVVNDEGAPQEEQLGGILTLCQLVARYFPNSYYRCYFNTQLDDNGKEVKVLSQLTIVIKGLVDLFTKCPKVLTCDGSHGK